jgi:hypothetical protein
VAEVNKILTEMQDSEIIGNHYWSKTRKNNSRISRISKEDTQKIEQWIQMPSKLNDFDVRTLKARLNFVIFAFYEITKELNVENAVKPSVAYGYLTQRYKTISVSQKGFSDTLSSKSNKKYFERTPEGLYFLTQEAENIGKGWIDSLVV